MMAVQIVDQFYGRVVDMVRTSDGSPLTTAAGIAATVLYVDDVTDFDPENGGQVQINGTVYDYVAVDLVANTVTLDTGLLAAAAEDDLVEIVDPDLGEVVVEYVANVLLDEQDPSDEPIEVPVQHALVNMLRESIRGGFAEAVTLLRDGPDDFLIFQVGGKLAVDVALEETIGELQGGYTGSLQDIYDRADQAARDAQDAADNATLAMQSADGKTKITISLSAPGATPNTAGEVWWRKESATQTIIGQWQGLGGTSWQQVPVSDAMIANLSAGKLIAGSAFINGLSVKTNFTLGDASTNGVIQSYNFAGSSVGVFIDKYGIVAKGGSIAGANITGGDITGAHIKTDSGGLQYWDLWKTNLVAYSSAGSVLGTVTANSNGLLLTGLSSSTTSLQVGSVVGVSGDLYTNAMYIDVVDTNASAANVFWGAGGKLQKSTASSQRYKDNIVDLDIDPAAMRQVRPRAFTYKPDYFDDPDRVFWGLIAEELEALGLPKFVDYDDQGRPDNVRYANLVVGVLALAQDNARRLDALEGATS